MTLDEFSELLADYLISDPNLRFGQAVFNLANAVDPVCAYRLRGGPTDPYHDDEKVPAFLDAMIAFDGIIRGKSDGS